MPDLDLLRYRPDLRAPRVERPDETTSQTQPTERTFQGVPPGAMPYLQGAPKEPAAVQLGRTAERCRGLLSDMTRMAGNSAAAYLKAGPAASVRYEAAAIADGDSLPAILMPAVRELADTAEAAIRLADALKDVLPADIEPFLDQLAEELTNQDYASAASKMTALATASSLAQLSDSLEALADELASAATTAPIDALGSDPSAAIKAMLSQSGLIEALVDVAKGQEKAAIGSCLEDLQRRKRVPAAAVLDRLAAAMLALIRQRQDLADLVNRFDLSDPALNSVAITVLASTRQTITLLQSGIGDISRVGALLALEWGEYIQTGRNRHLLKQSVRIGNTVADKQPEDVDDWLSRQGDLTRPPSSGGL